MKISKDEIKTIDTLGMFKVLNDFPEQVAQAIEIGRKSPVFSEFENPKNFLVLGMGGSAIGGDLLRSYSQATAGAEHLQIVVNRGYEIPNYIDDSWFVIASSYSGGTEETISGYKAAKKKTKNIIAITSGGELENLAKEDGFPVIKIPAGLMPRCALGYSFVALLFQLMRISAYKKQAISETTEALVEISDLLNAKAKEYSEINDSNQAIKLAEKLFNKIVVVYSAETRLDIVNLRWRGQIQENAKQLAFGSFLPEMNHNEINSWDFPVDAYKAFSVVMLQDKLDHERTKIRFDALKSILSDAGIENNSISGNGKHLLTRMFDLIYLADWTSYWLAMMNEVDPTPIPVISKLKGLLS